MAEPHDNPDEDPGDQSQEFDQDSDAQSARIGDDDSVPDVDEVDDSSIDVESLDDQEVGDDYDEEVGDDYDEVDDDHDEADDEESDFDEEEFTLDQLSEAYAKVLKEREGEHSHSTTEVGLENTATRDARPQEPVPEPIVDKEPEPEVDDDAACPISPESILESILFVGAPKDVALTSRNIAPLMRNVSAKEVTALAKQLNSRYEEEGVAYRVLCERGTMKMVLAPEMLSVQNFMLGRYRAVRLSQQAIDVLAIIAYNQPITRTQLDSIRTRSSGSIVRQMIRRGLVAVEEGSGRKDVYRTTDRFLDLFGLDSIEDLPQSHDASGMEELAD
ncbi:MAG: SMC-Scp complex subunit ScpB [Planctomycetota bacterium]